MSANQQVVSKPEGAITAPGTDNVLDRILAVASNPDVNMDVFERLVALRDEELRRQAESVFNAAMTAAQTAMKPVAADATNPHTQSRFATYAALDEALRPIYTEHGFALSFNTAPSQIQDNILIICQVSHIGGHSREYKVDMPADGKGAQGRDVMTKTHAAASAMSYGMRYLLKLIFNVAITNDDDGNAASGRNLLEELQKHNGLIREHFATLSEIKLKYLIPQWGDNEDAYNASAAQEAFEELSHEDQQGLWIATKKGGVFETHERWLLKVSKSEIPGETARGLKYV